MKRIVINVLLGLSVLGGVQSIAYAESAGQNHVQVVNSLAKLYGQLNNVLSNIKDEATAKEHGEEFQTLRAAMNDHLHQMSSMSAPSGKDLAAIAEQSKQLEALTSQINFQMERIGQNPNIKKHLLVP